MARKGLNTEQENLLDEAVESNPGITLCKHIDIATITHPEKFPHIKQSRVKRKLRDNALRAIKDAAFILKCYSIIYGTVNIGSTQAEGQPKKDIFEYRQRQNLRPSKYTNEIRSSPEFEELKTQIYGNGKIDMPNEITLEFAEQQFHDSLKAIFSVIPNEFETPLRKTLETFTEMFSALADSEKRRLKTPKIINTHFRSVSNKKKT